MSSVHRALFTGYLEGNSRWSYNRRVPVEVNITRSASQDTISPYNESDSPLFQRASTVEESKAPPCNHEKFDIYWNDFTHSFVRIRVFDKALAEVVNDRRLFQNIMNQILECRDSWGDGKSLAMIDALTKTQLNGFILYLLESNERYRQMLLFLDEIFNNYQLEPSDTPLPPPPLSTITLFSGLINKVADENIVFLIQLLPDLSNTTRPYALNLLTFREDAEYLLLLLLNSPLTSIQLRRFVNDFNFLSIEPIFLQQLTQEAFQKLIRALNDPDVARIVFSLILDGAQENQSIIQWTVEALHSFDHLLLFAVFISTLDIDGLDRVIHCANVNQIRVLLAGISKEDKSQIYEALPEVIVYEKLSPLQLLIWLERDGFSANVGRGVCLDYFINSCSLRELKWCFACAQNEAQLRVFLRIARKNDEEKLNKVIEESREGKTFIVPVHNIHQQTIERICYLVLGDFVKDMHKFLLFFSKLTDDQKLAIYHFLIEPTISWVLPWYQKNALAHLRLTY